MVDVEVAIKFLINNSKEKLNRFLCEYGNVILKLSEKDGIVKMYFYDEVGESIESLCKYEKAWKSS